VVTDHSDAGYRWQVGIAQGAPITK
jgi:hypothetical protein